MLHAVHIHSARQLMHFYERLVDQEDKPGDTNHFVHCVHAHNLPKASAREWDYVISILFLTPKLQSFQLLNRPVFPSHLRCLLQISAQTLSALDVLVNQGWRTIFKLLSKLPVLTSLRLVCENTEIWASMDGMPSLSLPSVTFFVWVWRGDCQTQHVQALCKWELARCAAFKLLVPQLSSEDAPLLLKWIEAHKPRQIGLEMMDDTILALSGSLAKIPSLEFFGAPPLNMFNTQAWPESISLVVRDEQHNSVFLFMDYLLAYHAQIVPGSEPQPRLQTVRIRTTMSDITFTWECAASDAEDIYAVLVGRLTHYATKLARCGVRVLDADGRDLRSYVV
jgi:hypothetical protein